MENKRVFNGEPDPVAENASYACCLVLLLIGIVALGVIYGLYKLII